MVSNKFEEDNKNIEQSQRKLGQIEEEVHERNRKIRRMLIILPYHEKIWKFLDFFNSFSNFNFTMAFLTKNFPFRDGSGLTLYSLKTLKECQYK